MTLCNKGQDALARMNHNLILHEMISLNASVLTG